MLTIFLITKPVIGSEVINPGHTKPDHPEPNLIITSGDIIHKNIYDDQSGRVVLIMIIKFESNLYIPDYQNTTSNIYEGKKHFN